MSGLVVNAAGTTETMQPPFGPAPPLLDGPDLPSFRFPLGAQPPSRSPPWIAANPDLLLGTNFKVPESVFAKFPKSAAVMPE